MSRHNFRANFLEKISVGGVEFGDSLSAEAARRVLKEQILDEASDVDLGKLARFVAKHHIPQCHYVAVWKLLLGISSCQPEGRAAVEAHRREEAEMLWRSLRVMRKTAAATDAAAAGGSGGGGPSDVDIVAMIKLANSSTSISALNRPAPISVADRALNCIAKQMFALCTAPTPAPLPPSSSAARGWIDAYWLTLSMFELLTAAFDEDPKRLNALVDDIRLHIRNLQKFHEQRTLRGGETSADAAVDEDAASVEYPRIRFLSDNNAKDAKQRKDISSTNRSSPYCFFLWEDDELLRVWFRSAGSSLLSEDPLYRLWDKACAGEAIGAILKFTLTELITLSAQQLFVSRRATTTPDDEAVDAGEGHGSGASAPRPTLPPHNYSTLEIEVKSWLTREIQMKAVAHAIENFSRIGGGIFNSCKTK